MNQEAARPSRILLWLAAVGVALALTSCDGGPEPGRLTLINDTDRPVFVVGTGSTLEQAVRPELTMLNNATGIGAGDERFLNYGHGTDPRPGDNEPWCSENDFWVLASKTDDVSDFSMPIDLDKLEVVEHLADRCWPGSQAEHRITG